MLNEYQEILQLPKIKKPNDFSGKFNSKQLFVNPTEEEYARETIRI